MSDNPGEKRQGFERWVASLKLTTRPSSNPPPIGESEDGPLTLDEQATLINRIPKEIIHKLRERDSQRSGMPKTDDSTAVFTPPPELLLRAKRFQAPPKPERSSPNASVPPSRPRTHPSDVPTSPPPADPSDMPTSRPPPMPSSSPPVTSAPPLRDFAAAEAAAFASLQSDEEATTYFKPDISEVAGARRVPAALPGDASRAGDMQWIDGLASSPPAAPPPSQSSPRGFSAPASVPRSPSSQDFHAPESSAPESHPSVPVTGSVAPSERRLRWVAILVALVLLAGIYALSRMQ